jgi:hypothetical protein
VGWRILGVAHYLSKGETGRKKRMRKDLEYTTKLPISKHACPPEI